MKHDDDDGGVRRRYYLGGVDGGVEQRRDGAAADADVRLHGEPLEPHLHLVRLHAQPALATMPASSSGPDFATHILNNMIITD